MASEVILPRVDMDMATGRISKWLADAGQTVAKGQPLFEIETDKAAMEIEAPAAGTLRTLVEASGEDIPVGSTVAWIYGEGEEEATAAPMGGTPDTAQATPSAVRFKAEDQAFDGALPSATTERPADASPTPASPQSDGTRATPLARRLAREQGLDLGALAGSGPRGRIQAGDVRRTNAAAVRTPVAASVPAREAAPAPVAAEVRDAPVRLGLLPATPTLSGTLSLIRLRDGSGTPTVLVHGWGSDANGWRPFLAGPQTGRPVLALDLPGHGTSPLGPSAAFADLADAVETALGQASLGPVHVVAHSLGAALMAAVAARHTLDLRSLLLLAPAGLGPSINGAFLEGFLEATSEASLTPWMRELVADADAITPAFVRAILKTREGTTLVETQRRIVRAVFPDATQAFSVRQDLAKLAVPTRVVTGGADRILPAGQATGLPSLVATHHFAAIGHMPHLEARDAVALIAGQMAHDRDD